MAANMRYFVLFGFAMSGGFEFRATARASMGRDGFDGAAAAFSGEFNVGVSAVERSSGSNLSCLEARKNWQFTSLRPSGCHREMDGRRNATVRALRFDADKAPGAAFCFRTHRTR